jgi:methylated-DNA-[protein]-cysteine S-methyltransferase
MDREDGSSALYYKSPIGWLEIVGIKEGIQGIRFVDKSGRDSPDPPACLVLCRKQLDEYFQGKGTTFAVPLVLDGTPFQKSVWRALLEVPYGSWTTYGEVARTIGRPRAARAVGQANNRNPVVIVVPCHRVVGNGGELVGYGSGLWRKEWLLEHEGVIEG